MTSEDSCHFSSRLWSVDWEFGDIVNSGVHSIHWYPAAYISAIPGTLIPYLTSSGDLVVDPFMGIGTTGVEAIRLGRRFLGIDSNPAAVAIAASKLLLPSKDELQKYREKILVQIESLEHGEHQLLMKDLGHPAREWYHPETFDQLYKIYHLILQSNPEWLQRLMFCTFSSVLVDCTSQQKHWGWICDNVTPTEYIWVDAQSQFARAWKKMCDSLLHFQRDIQIFNPNTPLNEIRTRCQLRLGDAVQRLSALTDSSVDCVFTSPPYYGVADYVKSQRLTYQWLAPGDLPWFGGDWKVFERLRLQEVGSRSFRHRRSAYEEYINYMSAFATQVSRTLRHRGWLVLVLGASNRRTNPIPDIIKLMTEKGLIIKFEVPRKIPVYRRRLMAQVPSERLE